MYISLSFWFFFSGESWLIDLILQEKELRTSVYLSASVCSSVKWRWYYLLYCLAVGITGDNTGKVLRIIPSACHQHICTTDFLIAVTWLVSDKDRDPSWVCPGSVPALISILRHWNAKLWGENDTIEGKLSEVSLCFTNDEFENCVFQRLPVCRVQQRLYLREGIL